MLDRLKLSFFGGHRQELYRAASPGAEAMAAAADGKRGERALTVGGAAGGKILSRAARRRHHQQQLLLALEAEEEKERQELMQAQV